MKHPLTAFVPLVLVFASACAGSPPAGPDRVSSAPTLAIAVTPVSSPFGHGGTDLAVCLSGVADAGCFTPLRLIARAAASAPGAPVNLAATVQGSTVSLTWGAPLSGDPATSYFLEAGSSSGSANLVGFSTGTNATVYVAPGVAPGTYYLRVRAENGGGRSGVSNEVVVVVGSSSCASAPGAPTGVTATSAGSTVTVTWMAPAGGCAPTSYVLQAGLRPGQSDLADFDTGSTATTFVAPGVGNGTYYIRVLARNAFGRSTASAEWTLPVGTTTPAVVDVNPKTANFLAHGGCDAAILTQRFDVTAPSDVRWEVFYDGFETDEHLIGSVYPIAGSGVGSVTYTLRIPKQTPDPRNLSNPGAPPRYLTCFDHTPRDWSHIFEFTFDRDDGRPVALNVVTRVDYRFLKLLGRPTFGPVP